MLKKFGEFQLDESLRRLSRGGQLVKLTGQALDLLCLLVRRPGELVSREEIKHHLWPDTNVDSQHSLDVLLNRLRAILGDSGKIPRYIETVPKRGYRFLAHVDCGQSPSDRQFIDDSVRRLWIYAAIALLAAATAILIVRIRYQKFIPPKQIPVSTSPCSSGRMTLAITITSQRCTLRKGTASEWSARNSPGTRWPAIESFDAP